MTKYEAEIERSSAMMHEETFYFGRPCNRGHDGLRYTSSKHCAHCERERLRLRRQLSNQEERV